MKADLDINACAELVTAHCILVSQGVLDAFGHISLRSAEDPGQFLLPRAAPPNLVEERHILAFGMDGEPVQATTAPLFSERYIHSEIYKARPDVQAICHHHSKSIMPFVLTDRPLVAVSQTGAFLGQGMPLWDSADEFGATRLLVDTPEQARSLARSLGDNSAVLMRGHGATVVGTSLHELVFKAVYACRDADYQRQAAVLGPLKALSAGEIAKGRVPAKPAVERAWQFWTAQLDSGANRMEGHEA